jgi:hypothetical protein
MTDLFDQAESQRLKAEGMAAAESARYGDLETARLIAYEIGEGTTLTADDVAQEMERRGLIPNLGPAAGSLFKGGRWEFTGHRVRSTRVTNHGRELKVWRLKP